MGNTKLTSVYLQFLDARMVLTANMGNNKTPKPTVATGRRTLSFCIVIYSMVLFDFVVLEYCYELEFVDDAT